MSYSVRIYSLYTDRGKPMRFLMFNTLKARDSLVEVGVPEEHATAYVSILAEVHRLDLEDLATKDYIEERFLKLEAKLIRKGCL